MHPPSELHRQDWWHVQQFLSGDNSRLEQWIREMGPVLQRKLTARGASLAEAEDILAHLWSDCIPRTPPSPSLLEKYSGQVTLQSWLLTVATRRLIDAKRRQRLWVSAEDPAAGNLNQSFLLQETAAGSPSVPQDEALLELLSSSLRKALTHCSPDQLLMLRLVYLHGLTQREISLMWTWHETKVSRTLSQAMQTIAHETLQHLHQSDPWLQITWEDFLELCESQRLGFL